MSSLVLRTSLRAARCTSAVHLSQRALCSEVLTQADRGSLARSPLDQHDQLEPGCHGYLTAVGFDVGFASRSFFHTSSPACDATSSGSNAASAELEARRKNINKILYRSRQRGLLELDLLMGRWATDNVPKMDAQEIEHYTQILEEENPDLWKWLTEQADAPADMKANPVFASLCDHVRKDLEAKADPATRTEPGRDWVRGWNDGDRKVGGPPAGNQ